jgi:hypothetical protein
MSVKDAKHLIEQRKRAYSLTFAGPHGESVLEDLARFCRANESCFHPDARVHAVMEGRRETFLRIQNHLNMSETELLTLLTTNRKASND